MYTPYQFQPMPAFQMQQQPTMQPMAQPSAPALSGRIVKSVEEIVPNEVPMNGSIAVFPAADMKAIFVKGWNPDGTISTVKYEPVQSEKAEDDTESVTLSDIMDQLNDIQDLLKPKKPATTKRTAKKEVEKEVDDDAE